METQQDETPQFVTLSPLGRKVLEVADAAADSDANVLIEGESGTGKELIAQRLHARSRRREGRFVPVNAVGISEGLFESELFGHTRGAFTGAEADTTGLARYADGGTLFLDEVGDIPMSMQPKLLRLLQDGEVSPVGSPERLKVDVRFVGATNQDIAEAVREGRFREDLFYRLAVVRIHIPPLRDRPEDVDALLEHYLDHFARRYGTDRPKLPKEVREFLRTFAWPGNVRQLVGWVERLFALKASPRVLACSLMIESGGAGAEPDAGRARTLKEIERAAIVDALRRTGNNRTQAARLLDIGRNTLQRKIVQYEINET